MNKKQFNRETREITKLKNRVIDKYNKLQNERVPIELIHLSMFDKNKIIETIKKEELRSRAYVMLQLAGSLEDAHREYGRYLFGEDVYEELLQEGQSDAIKEMEKILDCYHHKVEPFTGDSVVLLDREVFRGLINVLQDMEINYENKEKEIIEDTNRKEHVEILKEIIREYLKEEDNETERE